MSDTIPTRTNNKSHASVDDAWESFASQYDRKTNPLKDMKTPDPIDFEEVINDLERKERREEDSIWDHPKLQGFFSFVENKIKQMQKYSHTVKDFNNITFFELNTALGNHFDVYISLVSLYNVAEVERESAEQDFQIWWDDLYVKKRALVNPGNVSAQKWASTREIEAMVRVENKDDYKEKYMSLVAARRQVQFLRRLLEGWQDFKFALQTMSKNMQTEYNQTGQDSGVGQW